MTFLLANWKLLIWAIGLVAVAWVGWTVKGKFERAADADRLETEVGVLTAQLKAQVASARAADIARAAISQELATARAASAGKTKEIVRVVRQTVRDERVCDVPVSVLNALNQNRGADLSIPAQ